MSINRHLAHVPAGYLGTVGALAVGQVLAWASLYYSFSSFVLPMQHEYGWSVASMMGAYSLGTVVWGLCAYPVGAAIDQGHGRWVMAGGACLASLGLICWASVQALWMLYAAWLMLGLAMAMMLYEPAFTVLTRRYPTHYHQGITALTLVAGFASTLAFPAIAALQANWGWRGALWVVATVMGLIVAPVNAWALRGETQSRLSRRPYETEAATLHQATRTRAFWLLALTFTCYSFAQSGFWAHVIPAFASKGFTAAEALHVLVWIGPCQVGGRVLYVLAGRQWPLRRVGMVVLCGLPLSFALFAFSQHTWALWGFAALFGSANGLVTIVRGGLIPEYFGRAHVGRIGGAISTAGLLARAAAPLSVAGLLWIWPSYTEVMQCLAALGVIAVLAFTFAQKPSQN